MTGSRISLPAIASLLVASLFSATVFAHHGWSWAEGEQMTLSGTIESISMAPPHPTLHVRDEEDLVWQVDLGNPNQTARSGFTEETAAPGDAIEVIGNRSLDPDDLHMKAVRIVVDGVNYDMYPERLTD